MLLFFLRNSWFLSLVIKFIGIPYRYLFFYSVLQDIFFFEVLDPDCDQQIVLIPETKVSELSLILELLYTGSTEGESLSGLLLTLGSLFPELNFQVRVYFYHSNDTRYLRIFIFVR